VRINHLEVRNFNGFESRTFAFNPKFNLLVGENATGKTSVLDALSVAVGSWFLGMRGYEFPPGISQQEVRVVPYAHGDVFTFEKQFPSRIYARGTVMGNDLAWARVLKREGGKTNSVEAKAISQAAEDAEKAVRGGENVTLPLICAYGTERLWFEATHRKRARGEESKPQLPSRLDGYRDSFDFTIQESSLLDWIRAEVSVGEQRKEETVAFRVARSAILACVEGAKSLYYDERYKDLVVDIKEFGPHLFSNLSDGQRIVLTLVGDLVRRATALNPHLQDKVLQDTPGVVLIDELDLHLHPKWQRHIIADLKATFPSIQFIATTHSPQLVGQAHPDEVIRLGLQESSKPPQSFGMDSNWVLKHVMGTTERDQGIDAKLKDIESLINQAQLDLAKAGIATLRGEIGNTPGLVTLSARIDHLRSQTR
jgi:predicted ATP-binding protein involved in virulence